MGNNHVIDTIQKNKDNNLVVSVGKYNGHDFIDMRIFYKNDSEEFKPTKKGLAINTSTVDKLCKLLVDAKEYIESNDTGDDDEPEPF